MGAYLIKRVVHSVLVLVGVLIIVFLVGHGIGDPAKLMLPPEAPMEQYLALRKQLGLDDPLYVQFGRAASGWVTGNFGESLWQRVPSLPVAIQRVPATLYLASVTMLIAIPTAIILGTISAVRPRSIADRALTVLSLAGVSTAEFWLGLMLILIFAVQLGLVPTSGFGGVQYAILPALALAFRPTGRIAQVARGAMALAAPEREEQRAFEDEGVGMRRWGQAIEQPLDAVPGEDELEILAALTRAVQEPLADGCGQVAALARAQACASM